MHAAIDVERLRAALGLACGNTLTLSASDAGVELRAADAGQTLTVRLPGEVLKAGSVTVSRRVLAAVAKAARGLERILLRQKRGHLEVAIGAAVVTLPALDAGDVPAPPPVPDGMAVIDAAAWRTALRRVAPSMSADASRPNLTGLLLEAGQDYVRMVATDGHRLSEDHVPAPGIATGEILVPRADVATLRKLLVFENAELRVHIGALLTVQVGACSWTCRPSDERFPNYRAILRNMTPRATAHVPARELLAALSIVRHIHEAHDFAPAARVTLGQRIDLDGASLKTVTIKVPVPAHVVLADDAAPVTLGINVRLMMEAVRLAGARDVVIQASDQYSPLSVQGEGQDLPRHIIMPMRL